MQLVCAILWRHLWPFSLHHIFSTFSHKRCEFLKTVIEHKMCVLIFYTTSVWNISHSKKNSARYCYKCEIIFMYSTHYSCRILIKRETPRQIFEKKFKYQVSPKSVQWEPSCFTRMDRQTDRQTAVTKLIVSFPSFANVSQNYIAIYVLSVQFHL
jgi:hypothetical protein